MTNLNHLRQNHPELIVRDVYAIVDALARHTRNGEWATEGAPLIRAILKNRGINKWLRVRRCIIQLKDLWKSRIWHMEREKRRLKAEMTRAFEHEDMKSFAYFSKRFYKLQGYCEALKDCRAQVRALTHSPRDVNFPTASVHHVPKQYDLTPAFPPRPTKRYFHPVVRPYGVDGTFCTKK